MFGHQIDRRFLPEIGLSGLGAVLAVAGMVEIVSHVQSTALFSDAICRGSGERSSVGLMFVDGAHCWGCPVAALGAALMLTAAIVAHLAPQGLSSVRTGFPDSKVC